METSIYELLLFHHPQALVDLDNCQHRHFGVGITKPPHQVEALIIAACPVESLEEIDKEMRKPPSRSRGE